MRAPPPSDLRPPPTSAAGLYVDLLKRSLTRVEFDDGLAPVAPRTAWKRRGWEPVAQVLDRAGLVMLRRVRFEREVREEGRDWPARAETMVGLRRLENLEACIGQVVADGVPGDLLEAGVWRGGAAIFMRGVLAALGEEERSVWVCDSFEGLPKPRPEHAADAGDPHWTLPGLAVGLEEVRGNFARYGLLDERVRFLAGWFSETLPEAPIERLAVLRVDGDMYGSTMDVLEALYPKVSPGGFVIIDDYGGLPTCRAAVEDYRAEHGIVEPIEPIDWTGVFWRRGG
jgi:O-methyltransferase